MPERDPARRAVVTGLGAVMPIGNDFPTYWANLQAGVSGTRRIGSFDASGQEVQIAAEVLDFDPDCDLWVVTEPTPLPIRSALSNNIGLGGHNGAVIFKRYDGD